MKLKELRQKAKLSQKEMAKILNLTQSGYSAYETERVEPSLNTIIKFADYFHTTIDYVLDHEVPYLLDLSKFSQSQREIIDKIQNLSETNCNRVNDFIAGLLIAEHERQETIKKILGE